VGTASQPWSPPGAIVVLQLSNVLHHVGDDGLFRISITADRAKYRNLARDPWMALHVTQADFLGYVVLEGVCELATVAARPDDETVDELVEFYRMLMGEHPNWDLYRQVMVSEHRTLIRFRPDRAYGMLELPRPQAGVRRDPSNLTRRSPERRYTLTRAIPRATVNQN
jgi:PPOX class probable F420-dependent enzyme